MKTLTTILLALSVVAGASAAAQAYPYGGASTTSQQEPSPN